MNGLEKYGSIIKNVCLAILFIVSLWLVFYGQKKIGYFGLGLQVLGIIGLLINLYIYNRQYK
ncbi:MAG: hypothetical protein Q4A47_00420 [Erysipelotrichaceae bacterium]|nr:hypothetical protein [Erysipelotrichaceae bacterium]MDO5084879.1 hypothetical protein [Erysipelotrichaceae bacterium]